MGPTLDLPFPVFNQSELVEHSKVGKVSEHAPLSTGCDTGRREQMSVYFNFDSIIIFSIVISHNLATMKSLIDICGYDVIFSEKNNVSGSKYSIL